LGINYTIITDSNLSAGGTPLDVTKSSVGLAYGAGLDYKLNERWSLNLDYKHVYIRTNVKAGGAILTNADINPNLVSFGIGYHF
jgi:outer membrane protein